MLRGELVALRARLEADVPILETELQDDVVATTRSSGQPWWPTSPGAEASRYRITEPDDKRALFSVVELATDTLAGAAVLSDINTYGRSARIGLMLRPDFRGKGLGTDVLRVLCHYAFTVLGLHRVAMDTLADNHAMIAAAEQAGFTHEGVLREAAWMLGGFADLVQLGRLADDS
ncbi:MAG TPA: GNAT family protein [Pseudonocardiaceae bacterium]|jgi:RimJ/RimL family protein N-acetyltransferase|nr:GNAT family protein [Pseudonocardiaceae bacterium]